MNLFYLQRTLLSAAIYRLTIFFIAFNICGKIPALYEDLGHELNEIFV